MLLHPCRINCAYATTQNQLTLTGCTRSVRCRSHTCLAAVERPGQVGVYHSFPAFGGNVLRWAAELTPAVIHQEVYPPVLLQHWRHKFLHLRGTWGSQTTVQPWQQAVTSGRLGEQRTSFSFRMLHWRGVTDAGLEGGSCCLISWAAASSRPVLRLEITTLQPGKKWLQFLIIRHPSIHIHPSSTTLSLSG